MNEPRANVVRNGYLDGTPTMSSLGYENCLLLVGLVAKEQQFIIWGEVDLVRPTRPYTLDLKIRFNGMNHLVNQTPGNPRVVQNVAEGISGDEHALSNT